MPRITYSLFLLLVSFSCFAQFNEPVDSTQTQVLGSPEKSGTFAMPDVPKGWLNWTNYDGKHFSYKLGFAPIVDYTAFVQDSDSKTQVGKQNNTFELRSARINIGGAVKTKLPFRYFFSVEYKGFDRTPEENAFGITDAYIEVPIGSALGKIRFGKIKETFVYEMVGDAANLPHTERILNPFFASRNIGVMYMNYAFDSRMSFAAGWYNNWWVDGQSFKESANTYSARVTGLPYFANDTNFLHLGASFRNTEAEGNVFRYKGKNESNVTDYYVDTGNIDAKQVWNAGFESLLSVQKWSFLAEYVNSWCDVLNGPNAQFNGYYLTTSYVFKGAQRIYDKKVAYARRIMPDHKGGSWELVARISKLDMDDKNIEGGTLNKLYLGLNWWATHYWRVTTGYGLGQLKKDGLTSYTNSFMVRLQWIY
ncbi:OprO/OprP family phosphate-selective porin [Flavobacterium sp. AG291]|uniref:OprO/OprP family phosphate-selective porin n=1 Tax=Flavobacterium sp. AG291 TaxID=2184000 RepID=UPI000E0A8C39|nr:porin [Flavobacterium sp. AG291]RDI11907.1 phosphate-selective porin [Flavobacterium sp. AG291]